MEENELIPVDNNPVEYTDDNIRHLSDMEHVRTRPGMYIGKLGDGSHPEDGIYVLLKEVIDNSIDEFKNAIRQEDRNQSGRESFVSVYATTAAVSHREN